MRSTCRKAEGNAIHVTHNAPYPDRRLVSWAWSVCLISLPFIFAVYLFIASYDV